MATAFNRTITELDHVRIFNLLRRRAVPGKTSVQIGELSELIDAAELVRPQEIGADIVTMYSKLRVADLATGEERSITLCYPEDADAAKGMISVVAAFFNNQLGLRVGETAEWQGTDGKHSELVVRAIEFQPEASGDYTA